jgi:GDPmannose 4,6-dehydratase
MSTANKQGLTGIPGQGGSYLAEFLLATGCEVHGIERRASSFNSQRVDDFHDDPRGEHRRSGLRHCDLTDSINLTCTLQQVGRPKW